MPLSWQQLSHVVPDTCLLASAPGTRALRPSDATTMTQPLYRQSSFKILSNSYFFSVIDKVSRRCVDFLGRSYFSRAS